MAWTITPDEFDVVVVGSGLPECLVAGSCVKAGKSVLIIDAVDTYGSDFSSFTPTALLSLASSAHTSDKNQGDASASQEGSGATPQAPGEPHEHSLPPCSPLLEPLPAGCVLRPLKQQSLPLQDIYVMVSPEGEAAGLGPGSSSSARGYILDLAPKLVYQGEALVDLLVHCRCHHYVEFKAVDGCYLYRPSEGGLVPVPASRADIFRDRRLGLGDKRALMRFLQGAMEAAGGQGHLRDVMGPPPAGAGAQQQEEGQGGGAGGAPGPALAHVLAAEGLPPRLREVVLYGVAMCNTDQEPTQHEQQEQEQDQQQQQQQQQQEAAGAVGSQGLPLMSAAEGCAALQLLVGSQGRFGSPAAFMLPSYGCGSVAEAFVRMCAVHGAVTVLRQPVQGLVVVEQETGEGGAGAGAEETAAGAGEVDGEKEEGWKEEGQGSGGGGRVVGVVTAAGQLVRCGAVVMGSGTLSCLDGTTPPSQGPSPPPPAPLPQRLVSRVAVVMDGPLQPQPQPGGPAGAGTESTQGGTAAGAAAAPSLLTLVVPPRCPGVGNPHAVRGLQAGAMTAVCPAGRYLLYLSTPASGPSPHADLHAALSALVDTSGLQPRSSSKSNSSNSSDSNGGSQGEAGGAHPPSGSPGGQQGSMDRRPRALCAYFYRQPVGAVAAGAGGRGAGEAGQQGATLPGNVVVCPGPDGSLVGYQGVLNATEAVCRSAFPDVPWLASARFTAPGGDGDGGQGDGEEAAGGGGGGEDDDAVDELTAALERLKE